MVYFVRTGSTVGSKSKEAVEWAFKITDYLKSKHGAEVELLRNVTGHQNEIIFLSRAESVGAFEKVMEQLESDPDYAKLMPGAQEFFVDGSWRDNYFRSISRG